ncbi:MAG: hypothetical protein ACI9VR_000172 [Cognaticolwellia sp.]|jgi:uncharacterized protein (DUF697 family)
MANVMDTFRRVMEGDFSDRSEAEREQHVRELIQVGAVSAAAVSVQPVPLLDLVLVSPIQIAMVQAIGRVHGHKLTQKSVLEMLSTFGASLLAQNAMMAAAKFIPPFGWVVSVSMGYALTYAIGEVANHYFVHGRGVGAGELNDLFKRTYKQKRSEKENAHKDDASL